VGASKPEAYGNFYAWGETSTKSSYSWSNYQYASGSSSTAQNLGTHIAGTNYDAAKKNWGGDWVMPTIDQANELLKKCTVSLATVNGVAGLRFKGPNGNSIFIPMAGYKYDSNYSAKGTQCYIWTDTKDNVTNVAYKALALYFERSSTSAKANTTPAPRRSGVTVRAVKKTDRDPVLGELIQKFLFFCRVVPQKAEIAADQQRVFFLELVQRRVVKTRDLPVHIAGYINHESHLPENFHMRRNILIR
jgi:hypothetical protein